MKPLSVSDDAEIDFVQAIDWYGEIDIELALSFRNIVIKGFADIQKSPKLWSPYDEIYRHYVVKKFPYSIIYKELADCIKVDAVAHHSRRPGYWLKEEE